MSKFTAIEKKWQQYHEAHNTFRAQNGGSKPKYYYLCEFPYPSGAGLHVGHVRGYTALDVMARKKRMEGFNVLYPMGWDAFGKPAEEYAIKNKIHPRQAVAENIKAFKNQMHKLGFSFDWSREFSTTDPEYVKWTQWQFLKFFAKGMAYKGKENVNWCAKCKSVLSNEEVEGDGCCERCGSLVEQRQKEQWLLRMSNYAEDLISGLDDTKFQEKIKLSQINWIGKSEGAEVVFKIKETGGNLAVYTTRPDTLFGATYVVLAPEHPLITQYKTKISNIKEVQKYADNAKHKTALERKTYKQKTGVRVGGLTAVNPVNNKALPVYVSDYVMTDYGTGAIMAVPAHDQRDYEFAKKFNLDIIPVLDGGDIAKCAYDGDGPHINSGFADGLDNKNAAERIIKELEKKGAAKRKVNYKLKDWVFSRQRFWGEPIPLVYCEKHGWVAVPDKDLPVLLPDVVNYEPTDSGESPLANIKDWVNTTCPTCGGPAVRETDTMPNWAGSSWYWLRYMNPRNDKQFAGAEAMKYWGKVDFYNGGMEHAARHLLYARFWNQFLYNQGLVPLKEPFDTRVAHGMVLAEDGAKMSKSVGNVVNPDDVVNQYGADILRLYIMFIGDYEQAVSWNENTIKGCDRFISRVAELGGKIGKGADISAGLESLVHKTIKKVTDDINNMKFNTAVAQLMILCNEMERMPSITKADYRTLLVLLYPFAPHITEELNEKYNLGAVLAGAKWPVADAAKLTDKQTEIAVQINSKIMTRINIPTDAAQGEVEKLARSDEKIKAALQGKAVVKVIYITNKLLNFII